MGLRIKIRHGPLPRVPLWYMYNKDIHSSFSLCTIFTAKAFRRSSLIRASSGHYLAHATLRVTSIELFYSPASVVVCIIHTNTYVTVVRRNESLAVHITLYTGVHMYQYMYTFMKKNSNNQPIKSCRGRSEFLRRETKNIMTRQP